MAERLYELKIRPGYEYENGFYVKGTKSEIKKKLKYKAHFSFKKLDHIMSNGDQQTIYVYRKDGTGECYKNIWGTYAQSFTF